MPLSWDLSFPGQLPSWASCLPCGAFPTPIHPETAAAQTVLNTLFIMSLPDCGLPVAPQGPWERVQTSSPRIPELAATPLAPQPPSQPPWTLQSSHPTWHESLVLNLNMPGVDETASSKGVALGYHQSLRQRPPPRLCGPPERSHSSSGHSIWSSEDQTPVSFPLPKPNNIRNPSEQIGHAPGPKRLLI